MYEEAKQATAEVLEALKKIGFEGQEFEEDIENAFDLLLDGNWNVGTMLGTRRLLVINEDEYDQHMDDDKDAPVFEDQLCFVSGVCAYVWLL